ncbi:putative ethylene-responsive transcription factor 4 [Forsythia ovata]|uniref:Ethylene-responsive transcription factor 4 n=1 Tax=Forsythia ovata TaxID=205694 RepID=A0ABD1WCK3_9LAMI
MTVHYHQQPHLPTPSLTPSTTTTFLTTQTSSHHLTNTNSKFDYNNPNGRGLPTPTQPRRNCMAFSPLSSMQSLEPQISLPTLPQTTATYFSPFVGGLGQHWRGKILLGCEKTKEISPWFSQKPVELYLTRCLGATSGGGVGKNNIGGFVGLAPVNGYQLFNHQPAMAVVSIGHLVLYFEPPAHRLNMAAVQFPNGGGLHSDSDSSSVENQIDTKRRLDFDLDLPPAMEEA